MQHSKWRVHIKDGLGGHKTKEGSLNSGLGQDLLKFAS